MMAKRSAAGGGEIPVEQRIVDFAEDLGGLLGRAQEKAQSWLGQRDQVATTLASIRDTATRLLEDLSIGAAEAGTAAKRAYRKGRRKTKGGIGKTRAASTGGSGATRKRHVSAATRRKMAAAQKARWAKLKNRKG